MNDPTVMCQRWAAADQSMGWYLGDTMRLINGDQSNAAAD